MKIEKTSRKPYANSTSKVAEFLNSMLLMKSNEDDLYDSMFSNLDTSVFLDQGTPESHQQERRHSQRFELPLNVVTEDTKNSTLTMDLIVNLSTCGARIQSTNSLTKGDKVDMHILFPEMEDPFDIQGSVVWAQKNAGNSAEYGIEFDNTLLRINKVFEVFDKMNIPSSTIF